MLTPLKSHQIFIKEDTEMVFNLSEIQVHYSHYIVLLQKNVYV